MYSRSGLEKGRFMESRVQGISNTVFFALVFAATLLFHGCGGSGSTGLASARISGVSLDGTADGFAVNPSSTTVIEPLQQAQPVPASMTDPIRLHVPETVHAAQGIYSWFQLEAVDGVQPYSFTASGLPEGFELATATGFVGGTPTASGVASISFTVTDASGTAFSAFSLMTIAPALSISCLPEMHFTFDKPVSTLFAFPLEGKAPYEFAVTGLPPGLNLRVDRNSAAYLMGVPDQLGSHSVTLSVKDAAGAEAQADIVISVSRAGYWVETCVSSLLVGDSFNQLVCKAKGGTPMVGKYGAESYEYTITGLPPGIALVSYTDGTVNGSTQFGALVTGTATTAGNYVITAVAMDKAGVSAKGMGLIRIEPR